MLYDQISVTLLIKQVTEDKVLRVTQNGIMFACPGVFSGEFIAILEDHKTIKFILRSTSADITAFKSVFRDLISNSFPQCISGHTIHKRMMIY